jgi:hypothetical protein
MKKRVEKPKAKPVAVKSGAAPSPIRAVALSPHDQLHHLLRGTHAHKLCGTRGS